MLSPTGRVLFPPFHKCSVFPFFSYYHCSLPDRIGGKLLPSLQRVTLITQSLLLPPFLLQEISPTNEFHLYVEVELKDWTFSNSLHMGIPIQTQDERLSPAPDSFISTSFLCIRLLIWSLWSLYCGVGFQERCQLYFTYSTTYPKNRL